MIAASNHRLKSVYPAKMQENAGRRCEMESFDSSEINGMEQCFLNVPPTPIISQGPVETERQRASIGDGDTGYFVSSHPFVLPNTINCSNWLKSN